MSAGRSVKPDGEGQRAAAVIRELPALTNLVRLDMLDVQQIFGRAGRPQFEDEGLGIIITQHAQLAHYLGMLTHQTPIESQFTRGMVDNLNAEIVLGGLLRLD